MALGSAARCVGVWLVVRRGVETVMLVVSFFSNNSADVPSSKNFDLEGVICRVEDAGLPSLVMVELHPSAWLEGSGSVCGTCELLDEDEEVDSSRRSSSSSSSIRRLAARLLLLGGKGSPPFSSNTDEMEKWSVGLNKICSLISSIKAAWCLLCSSSIQVPLVDCSAPEELGLASR